MDERERSLHRAELMRMARMAAQRGDKAAARRLLTQVLEEDEQDEVAWLWMSALVDDPEIEKECLLEVLKINPNNELAQKHLRKFQ
jgi:hypothetical protein